MRRIAGLFAAFGLIHATLIAPAAACVTHPSAAAAAVEHASPVHEGMPHASRSHTSGSDAPTPAHDAPFHAPAHDIGCCQAAHSCTTTFMTGDAHRVGAAFDTGSSLSPRGTRVLTAPSFPPDPPPPRA